MSTNMTVKLGDVAHECRQTWNGSQHGTPIVGLEHLIPDEIELHNWNTDIEHTFSKKFQKGQVLLGRRRVYLRKAVVAPCDGICSGDITVIEAKEGVLPELLPFIIQNERFFDYAMQGSAGSLSPRVKWEHLKDYEFNLPPLPEQKVLADKLWAAYRLKESYKKLLAATEEMVKSQFIEMQHNSEQKNCLGDYIERCTPLRCGNRELPVLSVTQKQGIVFQDERFGATVASNDKSNYIIVPRGYLVQGIHIDESNFGIQKLVNEGIVSPAYKIWKFKNSDAIPELIEYYLRSEMAIKYFRSKFLGATVPRRQVIRKEDFLALPLNLPCIDKQKDYFAIYNQSDKSGFELRKSIDAIDAVIKSLINS